MSRFFDLVSKTARDMGATKAHNTTPAALERRSRLIKLDSNENPFGPSARAVDAMKSTLGAANSYPDDDCSPLRLKLAAHHGLPPDQVLVTAGSTGMLSLLCQTLLAPGLNAVTSERSFIVYSMAVQAAGAHLVEVPMRDDGFDLEAILAAIDPNTRIVFLANPNNPTGTMLEADVVEGFLERLPGHVVLVLDEAYYEFALHFAALRKITYSNSLDYVRQGASVVVLRTFSKAHGLAGLRVGYGLGPSPCRRWRRRRPWLRLTTICTSSAWWKTMPCSRECLPRDCWGWDTGWFRRRRTSCTAICEKMPRRSPIACRMKAWLYVRWGIGGHRIAFG